MSFLFICLFVGLRDWFSDFSHNAMNGFYRSFFGEVSKAQEKKSIEL